ncbi:N-acetylmuramic acid 6-phosphate etherase [Jannaschia sp. CCS1]|uniref:N-acetylmuramic acid 6-phosphate etherase n=1 Tax=Jannaschia sp. (strain CCS1) TaxID=290400 RepID=UPI000053C6AD|nr:N-acetylmuramic acid 6-phosphate etherase [Jannaschia sp. CCS1]ABD54274.1 sugar isomerase (SIS) [Jannaschia sp. CCS1]
MLQRQTEQLHMAAKGLDALPMTDAALILARAHRDALDAVTSCATELACAGERMADVIKSGGTLHYVAAGSSGLMAMADACELAGTFGIDLAQITIHMAGGIPTDAVMPGETEDDAEAAQRIADAINPRDAVILVSASGSTPYAVEAAQRARAIGATTICIANNAGTPLLGLANIAICLATPAEVLAGSTRMGAGTAQKAALNTMSTVMGLALGHVHDGMMVNVRADNAKLRARAVGMIAIIANVSETRAEHCLATAENEVKPAVLLAAGASDLNDAMARLSRTDGILRPALAELMGRR